MICKEIDGRIIVVRRKHEALFVERRSNYGQKDGQENERMNRPEGNDSQIHAEVEYLKDFRFCKCEHKDPTVRQSDSRQDL